LYDAILNKTILWLSLQDKFEINLEDEKVRAALYLTGRKRYGSWRHRCHQYYLKKGGGDEARVNPPSEFSGARQADWEWLCTLFQSPEWQVNYDCLEVLIYNIIINIWS
jgi:hypothetical protein